MVYALARELHVCRLHKIESLKYTALLDVCTHFFFFSRTRICTEYPADTLDRLHADSEIPRDSAETLRGGQETAAGSARQWAN